MTEPKKSIADGIDASGYDESFGANFERAVGETPFVGAGYKSIKDSVEGFANADDLGDLASASGNLVANGASYAASAAMEVTTFAMDPIGWLVSNGLNMLLELVQPLQDALHFVTGDGPSLEHGATNFEEIAQGFVALGDDFIATGDKSLKDWTQDAGEAARRALADFSIGVKGIGSAADSVAETLRMWSMVMVIIEEVIKAIITELISWLIMIWLPALAASIVSFGSSVAAAMAASVAKAAAVFKKVTSHLGKLGKLLDEFMAFLAKFATKLPILGKKLTNFGSLGAQAAAVRTAGSFGARAAQMGGKVGAGAAAGAAKGAPGVIGDLFDDNAGGDRSAEETRENLDM